MMDELLHHGEIEVAGRLVDASNATLFVNITFGGTSTKAIYKPIAGERPLWDFPDGNLASRERAAYLVSQAMELNCIPLTILRDGPFGFGMVQEWIEIDEAIDLENYFQSDEPQLRLVALLDAVINNTDRKIGHLIPRVDGRLFVCDHGVTFHEENKLRTVLWQWADQLLTDDEVTKLNSLNQFLGDPTSLELSTLIAPAEFQALKIRIETLLLSGRFPLPSQDWPHIPWPPF